MTEKIDNLIEELKKKFEDIKTLQELNDLKVSYQGKKGIITELNSGIKDVPNDAVYQVVKGDGENTSYCIDQSTNKKIDNV